jgi:AraC-like DNA-binding protein
MHKCIFLLFILISVTITAETRQEGTRQEETRHEETRHATSLPVYLNKPYVETMDSLEACVKRMEAAHVSLEDEEAVWNKIKAFAIARHDERLALCVDYYLVYNQAKRGATSETMIDLYQPIIDQTEKIAFRELMIRSICSQASLYLYLKNYEVGFTLCKKLEKLIDNISDEIYPDKILVYYAISSTYYQFHDYGLAAQLLKKAVEMPVRSRNLQCYLSVRNTLGLCYIKLNELDSADFYFRSIASETRFPDDYMSEIWAVIAQKNIAEVCVHRGEYEKAIPIYIAVFDYMSKVEGEESFAVGTAISLAKAYLHTGKIREVEALFKDRLKRERISDGKLHEWYETLNLYYQQTGKLEKALVYADSMHRIEKEEYETFNAMRLLRVEQQANALDIKLAHAEKEKTRNYLLFALAGCLLLAIALGIWIYLHRQIARKNRSLYLQIQELMQKEKEAEQLLLIVPEAELSPSMQLFRMLSERMQKEKLFTDPDLNRKKLADLFGTNETYIADAIREVTGVNIFTYLSDLRLQYTLELMKEQPDMTLDAVALDSGYGSYDSFLRLFTKKYGITPSVYRKLATVTA